MIYHSDNTCISPDECPTHKSAKTVSAHTFSAELADNSRDFPRSAEPPGPRMWFRPAFGFFTSGGLVTDNPHEHSTPGVKGGAACVRLNCVDPPPSLGHCSFRSAQVRAYGDRASC